MNLTVRPLLLVGIIMMLCSPLTAVGRPIMVTAHPTPIDSVLVNPGMGFETFEIFHPDSVRVHKYGQRHPASSVMYTRLWLADVLPAPGVVDFHKIDSLLTTADHFGCTVGLGFMTADYGRQALPDWLIARTKGTWVMDKYFNPDFSDPTLMATVKWFLAELGRRYDGDPRLNHVDIRCLGLWGEWHVEDIGHASFTNTGEICVNDWGGLKMPPLDVKLKYVQYHLDAFRQTPLISMINDIDGLAYGIKQGTGWRADCLGDLGLWSTRWNHMRDRYPRHLSVTAADTAWQHAPVAFEICWVLQDCYEQGWDPDTIFTYALRYHCSLYNNKSGAIPDKWWPAVERFLKRVGYRFQLDSIEHEASISRIQFVHLVSQWQNLGVAPPYRDYQLQYRLRTVDGESQPLGTSTAVIRRWLPGKIRIEDTFLVPRSIPAGSYQLDVAIVELRTQRPAIKLAIAGRQIDGWYPVSRIEVK